MVVVLRLLVVRWRRVLQVEPQVSPVHLAAARQLVRELEVDGLHAASRRRVAPHQRRTNVRNCDSVMMT